MDPWKWTLGNGPLEMDPWESVKSMEIRTNKEINEINAAPAAGVGGLRPKGRFPTETVAQLYYR